MEQELLKRIEDLENWKKSLESAETIPYEQMEAFKRRLPEMLFGEQAVDFDSMLSGASNTKTMKVVGARVGDIVALGFPSDIADGRRAINWWVSADDTVSIIVSNESGGAIDPASATVKAVVIRRP